MTEWNLSTLLNSLHEDIQKRLEIVRISHGHPGSKGDASERVWLNLLQTYLPQRYQVESGHVVDSQGSFSDQIDVLVFDRQYSPFIFDYEETKIIPAESVYAAFEAKQTINAGLVQYAREKVESVRSLHRTSLPIPHAGGIYPAKTLNTIIGGILTFESEWNPPFGNPFEKAMGKGNDDDSLDLGCVAAHGHFFFDTNANSYTIDENGKAATGFLLRLISTLQASATVPMIDVQAYSKWLIE